MPIELVEKLPPVRDSDGTENEYVVVPLVELRDAVTVVLYVEVKVTTTVKRVADDTVVAFETGLTDPVE